MAILNSIKKQYATLGLAFYDAPTGIVLPATSPQSGFQSFGNALAATGSITLSFPTGITLSRGKVRIRVYNWGGTTPTLVQRAYLWDGTNAVDIIGELTAQGPIVINYSSGSEFVREFCTEIAATALVFQATLAGTSPTCSVDIECYGTS